MASVAIRFCKGCSNMLYPQCNTQANDPVGKLVYKCRICQKCEEVEEISYEAYKVYSHTAKGVIDELKIDSDFASDPTLSRIKTKLCPKCGGNDVVFFQYDTSFEQTKLEIIYVCARKECSHYWAHQAKPKGQDDEYDSDSD